MIYGADGKEVKLSKTQPNANMRCSCGSKDLQTEQSFGGHRSTWCRKCGAEVKESLNG